MQYYFAIAAIWRAVKNVKPLIVVALTYTHPHSTVCAARYPLLPPPPLPLQHFHKLKQGFNARQTDRPLHTYKRLLNTL